MNIISPLSVAIAYIVLSSSACAIDQTNKTPVSATATSNRAAADEAIVKMDKQMQVMREMHEKMMRAKTPEERNALMAEHMKTMQEGMNMMGGMAGHGMGGMRGQMKGDMTTQHQMMEKRMEMMQSMMQMMMDGMQAQPPAAK